MTSAVPHDASGAPVPHDRGLTDDVPDDIPDDDTLAVLERYRTHARVTGGQLPEQAQLVVLAALSTLFADEADRQRTASATTRGLPAGAAAHDVVGLLRQLRAALDPQVIDGFRGRPLDAASRQILLHGLGGQPWRAPYAVADEVDVRQNLARVVVRWTGPEPRIEYLCNGSVVEPVHTTARAIIRFGQALLHERIAWLPADTTNRVRVDSRHIELRPRWADAAPTTYETDPPPREQADAPPTSRAPLWQTARRRAVLARHGHAFDGAWVLMDRLGDADDNAERLFEYLRENRPDINAWFSVAAGTPDHARLVAGRHGDRVVALGSTQWQALMQRCHHLVSSHLISSHLTSSHLASSQAKAAAHQAPQLHQLRQLLDATEKRWRFTYLQHGVITDDLSGRLDAERIDLLITSTPDEYDSITGDGTAYGYSSREVRLTGLPRFDRLRRIARTVAPQDRTTVLVAPTWQRRLLTDDVLRGEWVEQWSSLLGSPRLAETLAAHGLQLGFLPHPALQQLLGGLDLPAHVTPLSFAGAGVQRLFASAAALVTDYSSTAFNAAYVDRPVLYFQFDHDRVLGADRPARGGCFRYPTHGFGPVTRTLDDAVAALTAIIDAGCVPAPLYADRISRTFPTRDGRCCERVTAEIEGLDRPAPRPQRPAPGVRVVPLRQRSAVERTLQPTR